MTLKFKSLCTILLMISSFSLHAQTLDSDGDGIPNSIDLDDDNDGIPDCVERGLNAEISDIFKLDGSAVQINNEEIRITAATNYQSGQAWTYGKVNFARSFVLTYDAYLGTDDNGADGLATVFQNSPDGVDAAGGAGQGIGAQGIANGIVLEIDTYDNGPVLGDISNDHGQIWTSADQVNGMLTTAVDLGNLEDGAWHTVVVTWDFPSKTLSYTVSGVLAGSYTFPDATPITSYFGGASKVYFGYTASTGGAVNEQSIRFTNVCSQLPVDLDTDDDGVVDRLDTDSDKDGCPDALEGSAGVRYNHVHPLTLVAMDPNYAYRGQIKVTFDGSTPGTPSQVISTSANANGIPQLVNGAGNNYNAVSNPNNSAGEMSSSAMTVGQDIGTSKLIAQGDPECNRCFRPANTIGTAAPTTFGITSLGRAGINSGNWPMKMNGAYAALDAKTKGLVINRLTTAQISAIAVPVTGMMVFDITLNCLKLYDGSSWNCYTNQTCDDFNQ